MATIQSKINTRSQEFIDKSNAMQTLVDQLNENLALVKQGGGEVSQQRHLSRGKMLPRDRINALLDSGSPFLELSQFAAWQCYEDNVPCAGLIAGIGRVSGIE